MMMMMMMMMMMSTQWLGIDRQQPANKCGITYNDSAPTSQTLPLLFSNELYGTVFLLNSSRCFIHLVKKFVVIHHSHKEILLLCFVLSYFDADRVFKASNKLCYDYTASVISELNMGAEHC